MLRGVGEPKIAIAHDYLTQRGGAEKVVLTLTRGFPTARVHTTLFEPGSTYPELAGLDVETTWLNRVGFLRNRHRLALPFLPLAIRTRTIAARHTIVSSSGWAHGYRTTGSKIVYCYSPARWLYQSDTYLGGARKFSFGRLALRLLGPVLRRWDRRQARTATTYFAISSVVRDRIRDTYGIDAEVLPAPHSVDVGAPQEPVDLGAVAGQDYYLCISRLLPYKNVEAVVRAFNTSGRALVVVGAGPDERMLAALAQANVVLLKDLSDAQVRWLYAGCQAIVSASFEDFGLTPIEAASFGKPAVVLRWGGFLDTIVEGVTGVYFDAPEPSAIAAAVESCARTTWSAERLEAHAATFSEERFVARLREEIRRIEHGAVPTAQRAPR